MLVSPAIENGESTLWLFIDVPRETEDLFERVRTKELVYIVGLLFLEIDHPCVD